MKKTAIKTDSQAGSPKLKPGEYATIAPGLLYDVRQSGMRRWLVRCTIKDGARIKVTIGHYPQMPLADAMDKARSMREAAKAGADPRKLVDGEEKKPAKFGEAAETFLQTNVDPVMLNEKHAAQWRTTLLGGGRGPDYCKSIRDKIVTEITTEDILKILTPIWQKKPETAHRLRGRIERVIASEFVRTENFDRVNPAAWNGHLVHILPKAKKLSRGHHPALPYGLAPEFMIELADRDGLAARALEFLIHTAARSGEVRFATWTEIDLDGRLWIVPDERMKAKKEHRVPLTEAAIAVLEALPRMDGEQFIFPGSRAGKPMSDMTIAAVVKRMGYDGSSEGRPAATVHGFRSTFKDWATEETHHAGDISEAALAHKIKDKTQAAYQRGDLLKKRRLLMEDWSGYLTGKVGAGNIIPLRA